MREAQQHGKAKSRERIGGTSLVQEIRTISTFPPKETPSERCLERRDIRVRETSERTHRVCRSSRGYQRVLAWFPSTESWSSRYQGKTFRSVHGWLQNDWVDMRGFTRQPARGSKWALFILGYASYIEKFEFIYNRETPTRSLSSVFIPNPSQFFKRSFCFVRMSDAGMVYY